MSQLISIDPGSSIAEGSERVIYVHPYDETRLIKLIKPRDNSEYRFNFGDLTKKYFPAVRSRLIYKEYIEYARIMLRYQSLGFVPPMSHLYGFVQTNLGLGCLAERIVASDGGNGETLRQKSAKGTLTQDELDMFNALIKRIYSLGVRAGDSNPSNIVFGHRTCGANGPSAEYCCALVDGFGDFHAIPIRSVSKFTNKIGLDDSFKRMEKKLNLTWDKNAQAFQF